MFPHLLTPAALEAVAGIAKEYPSVYRGLDQKAVRLSFIHFDPADKEEAEKERARNGEIDRDRRKAS